MRSEPAIDRKGLRDLLRRDYGMEGDELRFIPVGFDTACYVIGSWFVKVWPPTASGGRAARILETTLPLLEVLGTLGLRARVAAPARTVGGGLYSWHGGMPVAVFPLLPGELPPDHAHLNPDLWTEMARVMAEVHAGTPAVASLPLERESFPAPAFAALERGLLVAERGGEDARGLDAVIGPRRNELVGYMRRLDAVRLVVSRLRGPRVLCHRDFHRHNLLVDADGRLSVLDWDAAAIAPAEHDLWVAAGEGLAEFLAYYWEAGGVRLLRREQFEFALLRRGLNDLAARITRILDDDVGNAERRELLDGIVRWGFDRCATVDAVLSGFSQARTGSR